MSAPRTREKAADGSWSVQEWAEDWTSTTVATGLSEPDSLAMCEEANKPQSTTCVGCYHQVRPGHPTDHAKGCPTGQNGTPNYS